MTKKNKKDCGMEKKDEGEEGGRSGMKGELEKEWERKEE